MERSVVEQSGVDEVHGQVRHPSQLHGAVDVAVDLGRYGGAVLVDDGVHFLYDVEVRLVVGVLNAGPSPGDVGELAGGERVSHVGLARHGVDDRPEHVGGPDQLFENVGFSCQGETVVQHFVQKFVHDHIVILYDCFRTVVEIVFESIYDSVKKFDNK